MMDTIGVVELDSARNDMGLSAGKLVTRRIGDQNLFTWMVRRISDAALLDRVIVVSNFAPLPSLPTDVEVFYSPGDPLERLTDAARHYHAKSLLCVRPVHPWIDPDSLDRLVAEAYSYSEAEIDCVGYRWRDAVPHLASQLSGGIAWYRAEALFRADRVAREGERDDVGRVFAAHKNLFQMRTLPPENLDRRDVKLTVSCAEDWEHVESIYDALGPELSWRDIADLLDWQPHLRARMASLNRAAAV